jgi:transcriptional regulator with XRE-family HTH domain
MHLAAKLWELYLLLPTNILPIVAISNKINFNKPQLRRFAKLFRQARLSAGLTQLAVATLAFGYRVSHCKVSRVERCAMLKVDAHALEAMAQVLGLPTSKLLAIDPKFKDRAVVVREATRRGFWAPNARQVEPERIAR